MDKNKHTKSTKDSKSTKKYMDENGKCESKEATQPKRERSVRDSKILKDVKETKSEQRRERGFKSEHESRREHDRESRSERYSKSDHETRKDREGKCNYQSKSERNSRSELEQRRQRESRSERELRNVKSLRNMRGIRSERDSRDVKRTSDNKTKKEDTVDHKILMQDIKELIMRALECELSGHLLEARMLYEESLVKLQICSAKEQNEDILESYKKYLSSYEKHVQRLRDQIEQNMFSCKIIEHIAIPEGSRGRSYEKLIGCYLNEKVSVVHIYEPCLTQSSQLENLINFVEVLVKNCPNLMFLRVITCASPKSSNQQLDVLHDLREELESGNISFNYQFDEQLKKPRVVFNTGVVIRCRRGLHIFKALTKYYKLGLYDYDFRRCESAEVDIYQGKPFSESISKADRTDLMESLLHA